MLQMLSQMNGMAPAPLLPLLLRCTPVTCFCCCCFRAKKLYEDRQSEMLQTLSQMNDRTEELDQLLEQKETANKLKTEAEKRLAVSGGNPETCTPKPYSQKNEARLLAPL
jgi:hypothetical protein